MPFDLSRAAHTLRQRHDDAFGFRFALLDLLFAAGCHVREQAVALPWGDALVVRTAGPAAPSASKRLVVLALDLELPGLHGGDPAGRWSPGLAGLGGPAPAIAWLAVLHGLLTSHAQRPWELIFVRGPALGCADFAASLLQEDASDADVAIIAPVASAAAELPPALDLVRLELTRARNIWRFPACDHAARVEGRAPFGQAWLSIRQMLASLGPGAAWTLHDLRIAAGENAHFSAVLRSSAATGALPGLTVLPAEGELRLLFPVNDALAAIAQAGDRLPEPLADALSMPLQAATLPDGLCLHSLAPHIPDDQELPDRSAAMALQWATAAVTRTWSGATRYLAVSESEVAGPVAAVASAGAEVWRTPTLLDDQDLPALLRATAALGRGFL